MDSFDNALAVVTGAGTGMGRELSLQLARENASLALCDLIAENMAETVELCQAANDAIQISTHICDVSDEGQVIKFRDETLAEHQTNHVELLFNNAGIGGGGSMVIDDRTSWERTFDVCWYGVYYGVRAFLPALIKAKQSHIVNTSSINGFWASLGPSRSHTSYSAAKFAVKGFTEALVTDLRLHAPHVSASVVMPGHVGTDIVINSQKIQGVEPTPEGTELGAAFRNNAPTTAATAAEMILIGVREGRWRILIGEDAEVLDALVREDPESAYEPEFVERIHDTGVLQGLVG